MDNCGIQNGAVEMMPGRKSDHCSGHKKSTRGQGHHRPELARRVGTSQQTIDKIENGKVQRSSYMAAIALELGVPLDRVMRVRQKSGGVAVLAGHTLVSGDRRPARLRHDWSEKWHAVLG